MADVADLAAEHVEREAPYLLAVRRPVPPPADGTCLNCKDPVSPGARFCDLNCGADWERAQERARVNGK